MTNNLQSSFKDQRDDKNKFLIEVSEKEKQLLMLIHTKGLLHSDVQELYRRVRSSYEKVIMYDNEQSELQDLEYCLWKLHYKHIDEFRKRIKCLTSGGTKYGEQSGSNQTEGFQLFLSEATEFYQNMIAKIRKYYRLPDESSFYRRDNVASFPEAMKIKQCHFLCHRFLVCLGDLARYREQYEKPDAQSHNWSMAATYYMEATAIWPDSGNPQNQLAVLATYVGDEFLALYHCIRSLAVKEPFPDARDNLLVLLERNRSSFPQLLSTGACFDFSKPSERLISMSTCSVETDIWSHFIRLISFFYLKSSFDDFPSAFALIMKELDTLMALDDTTLKASLESYQQMDYIKTGPFRALQIVSIFLYTLQVKNFEDATKATLFASTFIFMARFVDRCLTSTGGELNSSPLLPAILVFVEWLENSFDEAEKYESEERNKNAMSYFFSSFVELLNRLGANKKSIGNTNSCDRTTPLWEDYELRGFIPVAYKQESLDFSSHWECVDCFEKGIECRARRIITAGHIISNKSGGKFVDNNNIKINDTQNLRANGHSPAGEEEEVILFSPFTASSSPPRISAGPPSLSAWVVEGDNFIFPKQGLSPIAEGGENSTPPYIGPPPSAPLLPDEDVAWYAVPHLVLPQHRPMTSSEWLRQYLQTHHHNLVDRSNLQATPVGAVPCAWPGYYYAGGTIQQAESPPLYTALPLDYGYGRGAVAYEVMIGEQHSQLMQPQPLLQYLKERERQLQLQQGVYDPSAAAFMMRGATPAYMGNSLI